MKLVQYIIYNLSSLRYATVDFEAVPITKELAFWKICMR